jgi:hypothetical protein
MKNKEEIKKVITEHFGITSGKAYQEWLVKWRENGGKASDEDLEILSPDNIDCRAFWEVCEEMFGVDGVCNTLDGTPDITDRMQANRTNILIARNTGLLNVFETHSEYHGEVLEIGPGYGSIKNFIEVKTRFNYIGFDVYPKISDVNATDIHGYIPKEFIDAKKETFDIVISSNVFQHLSKKQREKYIEDVSILLKPGAYFLVNIPLTYSTSPDTRHMVLYGQFCPIPTIFEFRDILLKHFSIACTSSETITGVTGFVCNKIYA